MRKKRYSRKILLMALLGTLGAFSGSSVSAEEQTNTWDQAKQEAIEAAGAVKDAAGAAKDATEETSKDIWHKTNDESTQIFIRARQKSKELWQQTSQSSRATWETLKQESSQAWETAKEESKQALTDTKAIIHEATASEPVDPKATESK